MIPPQYSGTPADFTGYTSVVYPQQPVQPGLSPNAGQAYIMNQPAQIGNVNGCNQIFYTCSPAPVVYNKYKSCQSKFLGVAQILIGIMCIAFNATAIGIGSSTEDYDISIISYGIWGGIFFIITGSFGVAAATKKTRGYIITFMVLCIISAAVVVVVLILSGLNVDVWECSHWSTHRYCQAKLAMNIMLIILSAVEGIFVLWGSIICCRVACCGNKPIYACYVQPQPGMLGSMNLNPQVIILTSPNVMSQPIPNAAYSMATAPIQPTTQAVTMNMSGMDSSAESKTNPVFQVD